MPCPNELQSISLKQLQQKQTQSEKPTQKEQENILCEVHQANTSEMPTIL